MSACYVYIIIKEGNILYAHNHSFFSMVFAATGNKLPLYDSPHSPDNVYTEF